MSGPADPIATTFDTFVGAAAGAAARLGLPAEPAGRALVATGRAFRVSVEPRLRPVLPEDERVANDEALAALGLEGELLSASGEDVGPAVIRVVDEVRRGAVALLYGVGGPAYGLVLGAEEDRLVARSALVPAGGVAVPIARLASAGKHWALLVRAGPVRVVSPREVALGELGAATGPLCRGPAAYETWARTLATHPLSRLSPEGNAWALARVEEARRAALDALPALPDAARAALEEELRLLARLRLLFPLPEGGSLSAARLEEGASLLREAAGRARAWLEVLAGGASTCHAP